MDGGDILKKVRERYSEEELLALAKQSVEGLEASEMISEYFIKMFAESNAASYNKLLKLFICDLEDVPLFVNEQDPEITAIVKWRLDIAK